MYARNGFIGSPSSCGANLQPKMRRVNITNPVLFKDRAMGASTTALHVSSGRWSCSSVSRHARRAVSAQLRAGGSNPPESASKGKDQSQLLCGVGKRKGKHHEQCETNIKFSEAEAALGELQIQKLVVYANTRKVSEARH
jgi:hypothetical protein